jgi:hypothetical protein
MIERFTREQFEEALAGFAPQFEYVGAQDNEECYIVPVNALARIFIRSSVNPFSGIAEDTGDDSIRLWIQVYRPFFKNASELRWQACGKKVDAWTTRIPGWEGRMEKKFRTLWERAAQVHKQAPVCPDCGRAPWVSFSKSEKNPNRPYASCNHGQPRGRNGGFFTWLDEPPAKGDILEFGKPESEEVQVETPEIEGEPFQCKVRDIQVGDQLCDGHSGCAVSTVIEKAEAEDGTVFLTVADAKTGGKVQSEWKGDDEWTIRREAGAPEPAQVWVDDKDYDLTEPFECTVLDIKVGDHVNDTDGGFISLIVGKEDVGEDPLGMGKRIYSLTFMESPNDSDPTSHEFSADVIFNIRRRTECKRESAQTVEPPQSVVEKGTGAELSGNAETDSAVSPGSGSEAASSGSLTSPGRNGAKIENDVAAVMGVMRTVLSTGEPRKPVTDGKLNYERQPNNSQLEMIEAPKDTDICLLAPPGSGKTFAIEHRYLYLVEIEAIDPHDILVVTYSAKMAEEMGQRIKATCPQAYLDQISTIHAFCYRVLTIWDESSPYHGWKVPKNWEIIKLLEELIERYWITPPVPRGEGEQKKPTHSEVQYWIDLSKNRGLTVAESEAFFVEMLGHKFGGYLADIRQAFDKALASRRAITFADMLYLMEHTLKRDALFRVKLQRQFPLVIVDEGQDTNEQALRILITISLEPGQNTVYGGK